MKTNEIKELTTKEINEKIDDESAMLLKLKLNHAVSPLENPLKLRHTRRHIAKLQTELNKRVKEQK
ncbi:MAG: 50S ribosomal protein L29 [Bacteroidetes bacterium GWA2_30_7]|nr:MAG: 50S ribosomal protein L29 [Bacteroidetes bacterium GWA2_30_7]